MALVDPDPRNAGKGLEILRAGGMEVRVGTLAEQAQSDLGPYLNLPANRSSQTTPDATGGRMSYLSGARANLGSRLILLMLGCGLGAWSLVEAVRWNHRGQGLLSIGFILFGLLWFHQPPILNKQFFTKPISPASNHLATAIGPAGLRMLLVASATAFTLVGVGYRVFVGP
ncbi:MAG TPA: hypothetical protein VGG49_11790 [Steroidobacteraceae bacterium]